MPSVTPESSTDWWVSWVAQPVCKPPCWQNITPGITTFDEAISILEQAPGIRITYKSKDALDWEFSKREGGTLRASKDGTVEAFSIGGTGDNKLLLKTIVGAYGEPEYVKPFDCNVEVIMCYVALVYPDLGMFLTIYMENNGVDGASPKVEISPNNAISRVDFFKAGIENFPNLYNVQESEVPIQWKGFGKYP